MTRWQRLLDHWEKDFRLIAYVATTLFLFRLVFLISFSELIEETSTYGDILLALMQGLRYDLSTAATLLSITILLSLLDFGSFTYRLLMRLRELIIVIYVPVTLLLFVVDLIFFAYFNQQIDQRVSGLWQDNVEDLMLTFWKDSHPILYLSAYVFLIYLNYKIVIGWYRNNKFYIFRHAAFIRHNALKVVFSIVFVFAIAAIARGSFGSSPLSYKHAEITGDTFLNKIVMNPYNSLRYTYQDLNAIANSKTLKAFWPEGLDSAIRTAYPQQKAKVDTLSQLFERNSKGLGATIPKHIFVVVMESHSGWPLFDQYQNLGISPRLVELGDKGIYLRDYLSENSSTLDNLAAIMTSFPARDVKLSVEPGSLSPYETSIARQLGKVGYATRFYYGGGLKWRRIGIFTKGQGFTEAYGFSSMQEQEGAEIMNGWKVHDDYIYSLVESKLSEEPSLNVILTTSNHPPFEIDWTERGYPGKDLPDSITVSGDNVVYNLGALWYADKAIGEFVARVEQQYPDSLFIITGDHREKLGIHFKGKELALANFSVPLVIYGPAVLGELSVDKTLPASHLNLLATIMDLALPRGEAYYATSPSIFDLDLDNYVANDRVIISEDRVIPLGVSAKLSAQEKTALRKHEALSALVWQRVRKGDALPAE